MRVNIPAGGPAELPARPARAKPASSTTRTQELHRLGARRRAISRSRDPTSGSLGGFVGVGNGFNANDETATAWLIGAEGQFYLTDWTLYGQLGYMDADEVDTGTPDAFRDAWFGRGVVRYFLDANVKLEGELSYASGEQDTDADDMDVWGWGLRYERALPAMDASFFLAYQGNYYDSSADAVARHSDRTRAQARV